MGCGCVGRLFIRHMSLGSIDSLCERIGQRLFQLSFPSGLQIFRFCLLSRCVSSIIFSEVITEVAPRLLSGVIAVLHKLIISGSPEGTHRTAVNR